MGRLRIAVLFGGCSEEHAVSVKSAQEVANALDLAQYEPFYVGITRSGAWRLCDGPVPGWEDGPSRPASLSPDRHLHGLLVRESGHYQTIQLDVVFPVLHGTLGEDGAVQGLLELSGIPYVGCDLPSSVLCMDKSLAYMVARGAGVLTPEFRVVAAGAEVDPAQVTYPVFVKPARSGSSFGVSKVIRSEDMLCAIEAARRFDAKVLIEEAVVGSEVGCAVLGNDAEMIVSEPDRVALSHGFFRIHQEEMPERGSENATFVVPADISPEARNLVKKTAITLYHSLGCQGLARVDMFLKDEKKVVLNEINTLPGLTSYSRFPRMMAAAGVPLAEVIDRVISLALRST